MRKRFISVLLSFALLLSLVPTAFAEPISMTLVQETAGDPNKEFVYYITADYNGMDTKQAHVEKITASWNKCNCGFVVFYFMPNASELWRAHTLDCGRNYLVFSEYSLYKVTLKQGESITYWPNQSNPLIYAEQDGGYTISYSTDGNNFTDYVQEGYVRSVANIKFPVVQNGTLVLKRTQIIPQTSTAKPTNDNLWVNGQLIPNATIYKIDGSNYFKLRDVAAILSDAGKQCRVSYDGIRRRVSIRTGRWDFYQPDGNELAGAALSSQIATISNDTLVVDGEDVQGATIYKINGSNYFKLRDLGDALGFEVDWVAGQGVFINTKT